MNRREKVLFGLALITLIGASLLIGQCIFDLNDKGEIYYEESVTPTPEPTALPKEQREIETDTGTPPGN
jgi:hypothetical protein